MKREQDRNGAFTPRFEFRPGVNDFPDWRGVVREPGDPGSIPPNALWDAINVRFKGVSIVSRGGQSAYADLSSDCVTGIKNIEGVVGSGGGPAVLLGPNFPYGVAPLFLPSRYDPTADTYIFNFDGSGGSVPSIPPLQIVEPVTTPLSGGQLFGLGNGVVANSFSLQCFFRLNDQNYALSDGRLNVGDTPVPAVYRFSYSPTHIQHVKVLDLPEACSAVTIQREREVNTSASLDAVNDIAYFLGYDTKLYRWSVATGFTEETHGGSSERGLVVSYQGNIYVVTKESVRKRDSAGSFSSVSLPAYPAGDTFIPLCSIEVGNILYIGGAVYDSGAAELDARTDPIILSYDGSTISVARHITGGIGLSPGTNSAHLGAVFSFTFAFGSLYFSYTKGDTIWGGGAGLAKVGSFDGSTWTDNAWTALGALTNTEGVSQVFYNGKDILLGYHRANTAACRYVRSQGSNLSSTVVSLTTTNSAFGQIFAIF